jgi:GT2 family glycosyltransferase
LKKAGHDEPHYLLIVDYDAKYKETINKFKFTPVFLNELEIPKADELIKKYSAFELSNILKPFFMEWLLKKHSDINNLVYLDTDIYVYSRLSDVLDYMTKNNDISVILTPHLFEYRSYNELSGYKFEETIFDHGLYNGGFYVLRNDGNSFQFLEWHKKKMLYYGYDAQAAHMFVDQKILDFAPILFKFVDIYKSVSYNVAYWNYFPGLIKEEEGVYYIGKERLVFFHYSQLKTDTQDITGNFYIDISPQDKKIFRKMVSDYWLCLKNNGHDEIKTIPYAYNNLYIAPPLSFTDPFLAKSKELASSITDLNTTKSQLKSANNELASSITDLNTTKSQLKSINIELDQKIHSIEEKDQEIKIKDREIGLMVQKIENKSQTILSNVLEIKRMESSKFWKMKIFYEKFKHPVLHFVKLFRKALYVYKRDGFKSMLRRSQKNITYKWDSWKSNRSKPETYNVKNIGTMDTITVKEIEFMKVQDPMVSIIIPVFNKWKYTYNCLKSLKENISGVSFEIVIVDDGSTDETKKMIEKVKNVVYIKNKKNIGFVGSCNAGAKKAKGEYLVFLNNDTFVKKNWLNALLETFQKNKNIGLVGSKLIYPDGKLQEAGGIVWKNNNVWNYGRYQNPNDPEFNYLKDVDYCSGASIILRKDTFEKLGGFDVIFSPGYCEDSDLAFRVRRLGLRTVYQPKSELFHFEGITSGNDLKSGMKKYQKINKDKFFKRWHDVLEKENLDDSEGNLFLARDRSKNKKTIIFVDNNVPTYDQDAGSRTVYQYIKLFLEMNYKVIFIPDNFHPVQPYTGELEGLGVEILYGPWYFENWKKWLIDNKEYIDYFFLNRAWNSVKYLKVIKNNMRAKVLYYPVDITYIRELRQYEITRDKHLLIDIEEHKKLESFMFKNSDMVITISEYEKDVLNREFPESKVTIIPTFIYDRNFPIINGESFDERQDLLFVGGFAHKPNADGVRWFINNVFPLIKEEIPGVKFNIIGSNPPDEINNFASEDIKILGFVSEKELEENYSRTRIVVAPLRYGAGVKGKIIESIAYGVPVVTTSIGAEGIVGKEDILLIADSEHDFAKKVIKVYNDGGLWKSLRDCQIKYARSFLSKENAKRVVEVMLDRVTENNP